MVTFNCCVPLFLIVLISNVYSARILGVFPVPSVSHQIVFQPIWKELSLRGHEVTVITPNPLKDPSLTNLTEIDLSFTYKIMEGLKQVVSQGTNHWTIMNNVIDIFLEMTKKVFENEEVQKIINDNATSYDVILVEVMDLKGYAFAGKFKCPLIGIASLTVLTPTHEAIGNPIHPVLHPDIITPYYGGDMGFFEKIDAILFYFYQKYFFYDDMITAIHAMSKEYFRSALPDFYSVERNMSMLFLNTNPIIHGVRPYGANVIEFGDGIHIKAPKPLPSELKTFLDNSTQGVIYFSLGSNVKSIYLPEDKKQILMKTFANLPYKVLWKFEDDELEGKPENVKINKWLPQQDVLRHPNIKLFITQAGLQSMEEALTNGIPLLALPFMGDQQFNAKSIEKLGVGLQLDFQTLSEELFHSSILKIIQDPKYKEKALEIGKLLKDQPMTGLEKVVWWTEYVIRNQGAPYLKSPRANVSWAEFLILDVVTFLLFLLFVVLLAFYKISQYVFRVAFASQNAKIKNE